MERNRWPESSGISSRALWTRIFTPFGFFLSFWLIKARQWVPGRAFLVAIFIGISVSLSIEMLQSYFPTRDSSLTDLICNTLGAILGVMFFVRGRKEEGWEARMHKGWKAIRLGVQAKTRNYFGHPSTICRSYGAGPSTICRIYGAGGAGRYTRL
ncbi:MAG: VanZ family protein [Deltaproteobacteria bacterium]|nr:VanZ family protein [Deltaproteobacteria bacterium]